MKRIEVAESVVDNTPEIFKKLAANAKYKLTKIKSKYQGGFVVPTDTVTGSLRIVDVAELGLPGVKVVSEHGVTDYYIRTSPIVDVLDSTKTTITFETEGGVYKLEKL